MKEYGVLILAPYGQVLDQHILMCADDDEAREMVRVLADSSLVEIWVGPVRIVEPTE